MKEADMERELLVQRQVIPAFLVQLPGDIVGFKAEPSAAGQEGRKCLLGLGLRVVFRLLHVKFLSICLTVGKSLQIVANYIGSPNLVWADCKCTCIFSQMAKADFFWPVAQICDEDSL